MGIVFGDLIQPRNINLSPWEQWWNTASLPWAWRNIRVYKLEIWQPRGRSILNSKRNTHKEQGRSKANECFNHCDSISSHHCSYLHLHFSVSDLIKLDQIIPQSHYLQISQREDVQETTAEIHNQNMQFKVSCRHSLRPMKMTRLWLVFLASFAFFSPMTALASRDSCLLTSWA